MKQLIILSFIILFSLGYKRPNLEDPIYKDKNAPIEDRVKDLVGRMTLEEKILQLNQSTYGINTNVNNIGEETKFIPPGIGSLIFFSHDPVLRNVVQKKSMPESRLGIPILFGFNVIHGFRTVYPISLAQACSWNPALVTEACKMAAEEAALSGVNWTFSPMIDVLRDPRWGRVAECYGEDPYTNAIFGVATVNGYQGKNLADPYSIAACLKHFVGYGRSEGGRDYQSTDISTQSLWETYLVPYEACIKAGASFVMSAFNDISGVPATANHYLLTEVLKNKWKHDGFVVSDWDTIEQLTYQGVAANRKEAGHKAFTAGVEMDMKDSIYSEFMSQLIDEKKISIDQINDAVSRVLRIKFRLGLFDNPYTTVDDEKDRYLKKDSIQITAKLAAETMVLLKNENQTLPLSNSYKKIALIGPMAMDKANLLGAWSYNSKATDVESIREGLEKELKNKASIQYARGCDFDGNDISGFSNALQIAKTSDIILLCLGEKSEWSGENPTRLTIALPAIQEKLLTELAKTRKKIVLILSNGRPLELARLEPITNAIVEIWQPGVAGGSEVAGILSGRINPSGKLAMTFPLSTRQIPVYYNQRQSARPFKKQGLYQDILSEPLYWFGHGLSYTTYQYGTVKLSATKINKTDKITAEVEVTNCGAMTGAETVLWYFADPVCSISRPIKELKYFEKKELTKGGKTVFTFMIDPFRDLSYVNSKGDPILEAGEFLVLVNNQKIKFELVD